MKIIKTATKHDTSTIISVDASELKLFELQKTKRVKTAVEKSVQELLKINELVTNAIQSATTYYNTAYRSKIECVYTYVTVKPKVKAVKNKITKSKTTKLTGF